MSKICLSCSASRMLEALLSEMIAGEDMHALPFIVLGFTHDSKRDERRKFVKRGKKVEVKEAA